jgi:hypothetical protein
MIESGTYRVLGLDPGGTTGWATYTAQVIACTKGCKRECRHHEFFEEKWKVGHLGPDEHHGELYALMEHLDVTNFTVVCESFEFRQNRQRDNINLMSKEYIGVTKLFGVERKTLVVFQTAGMAKPFVTDDKLKAMGKYTKGYKHANDAMRHLIYYLVNKEKRYDLIDSWRDMS